MTFTNVDIFNNAPAGTAFNWGIFGDGSGTYGVLDADGHITTAGTQARGGSRPFNWTNVRVFGQGGMQMLMRQDEPR